MYEVGNTGRIVGDSDNPQSRKKALEGAATIDQNGWRVWVEHHQSGARVFESEREKAHRMKGSESADEQPDTNYPNTYAYDLVRGFAGHNSAGTILSRGDAGQVCVGIAKALGMSEHEFTCRLADYAKANDRELAEASVRSFQIAQRSN